ncbi:WXG100 family type VII secretion target [Microbacterium gorillae]|uniref:WXG100 family type VII secretion target n=1 Tax=Microbacterium gorillae TaxID=1231063 RepID=UPI000590AE8C|nr:WXG100 family type VII secretion target [Microbacterium gorillae]
MAVFSVDSDEVIAAAMRARATAARIRQDVDTMAIMLVDLQSTWTGAASAGFQRLLEEWRAADRTVDQALDHLNQTLDHAGRSYTEAEGAAMAMFR